jgi:hypothetical protein
MNPGIRVELLCLVWPSSSDNVADQLQRQECQSYAAVTAVLIVAIERL